MSTINRVRAITSTVFNSAALDPVNYQLLKTLEEPIFYIKIINNSTQAVEISYDNSPNPNKVRHDYIPVGSSLVVNFQSNNQIPGKIANLARGTNIFVRGTAGVGGIYFVGYTSEL